MNCNCVTFARERFLVLQCLFSQAKGFIGEENVSWCAVERSLEQSGRFEFAVLGFLLQLRGPPLCKGGGGVHEVELNSAFETATSKPQSARFPKGTPGLSKSRSAGYPWENFDCGTLDQPSKNLKVLDFPGTSLILGF